jgi:hypothetical protein
MRIQHHQHKGLLIFKQNEAIWVIVVAIVVMKGLDSLPLVPIMLLGIVAIGDKKLL